MSKFFVKQNQINKDEIKILNEDVNHIKNVLRLTVADEIIICDEDNSINYMCNISEIEKDFIICKIKEILPNKAESNVDITIYQGLPKADKMELIIQKSTELGANKIVPVALKRCIVKLEGKDEKKKIERWQKIAEVASKQSGRDLIPKIENIQKVTNIVENINNFDLFFVAYEEEKETFLKDVLKNISPLKNSKENIKVGFLIGPEGGIAKEEVETLKNAGAKVISLGNRILRTETVALSVTSIIMYELENFGGSNE